MKLVLAFGVLAIAAGMFVAKTLDRSAPLSGTSQIEQGSVAFHCTKAIPEIFKAAKDSGDNFNGVPESVAFVAFKLVATNYCTCTDAKFGQERSEVEKEVFGQFAGLNLKLEFSRNSSKEYRAELQGEGQEIFNRNRELFKTKPEWFKDVNKFFNTCKKEQKIRGNLLSHISG